MADKGEEVHIDRARSVKVTGATGDQGDQGDQGDKGSKGAKGDEGKRGATGYLVGKSLLIRDFWQFMVTVLVVAALGLAFHNINEQKEGRRLGTTITCVITSAILHGSHNYIVTQSSAPIPGNLEPSLIKQGYPTKKVREQTGVREADKYTEAVADAVVASLGQKVKGLITSASPKHGKHTPPAGTVNCERLKIITKATK